MRTALRRLPVRVQVLVDLALLLLFFSLDARDLVFKTKWLGPEDSFSFSTTTQPLRLEREPLVVAAATIPPPEPEAWSVQSVSAPAKRSGWTSFLQKCQSLHAITSPDTPSAFSHVLAKNCQVGRRDAKHTMRELVLSSSVRADSIAWAACKMLFHHRKPPVCHAPIVRLFGHRYNMDDKPSLPTVDRKTGDVLSFPHENLPQGAYSALPGSSAEMEIIELLAVISKSSPLGSVVCVEAFAPSDAGYYTSSFFGCGSPTYNHSAFVGHLAKGFQQYHQDKAWLTADMLHVSGMTYMVRENRRSIFHVKRSASDGSLELEHRSQLNFSCFGVLYTIATSIDLLLLLVHVYSALEILKLMLWPLWKSLVVGDTVVSRSSAKMAFTAEDCQAVLTASLYRSKPIVVLIVVADLLHWMTVVSTGILLSQSGVSDGAKVHAMLSVFRFWVLSLLALHSLWDAFVALFEKRAFAIVHGTYITVGEVATIAGVVGFLRRSTILSLPALKYEAEGQRLTDTQSFVDHVALSNAFPEHHDSQQNTRFQVAALLYGPLAATITWSLVAIACFVGVRFAYFQWAYPRGHNNRTSRFSLHRTSSKSSVKPDLQLEPSPAEGPSPPSPVAHRQGSPKRSLPDAAVLPTSSHAYALRLPLEKVVDVPIRARSLVRNSLKMEKQVGAQLFLRPPQYLEHGIILQGGCLQTRFGFVDIVHPYLRAGHHVLPDGESSRGERRLSSSEKLQQDAHTLRLPLVPLR